MAPLRLCPQRDAHLYLHGDGSRAARSLPACTKLLGTQAAVATLLTAIYPIWFAQSTLAHADIFAAAFTLWGFTLILTRRPVPGHPSKRQQIAVAALLAGRAVEGDGHHTPVALAIWEGILLLRARNIPGLRRAHIGWFVALSLPFFRLSSGLRTTSTSPVLPLAIRRTCSITPPRTLVAHIVLASITALLHLAAQYVGAGACAGRLLLPERPQE